MAQHIIRDAQGRVEKILDDVEFAEHKKKKGWMGCLTLILFFAIVAIGKCNGGDTDSAADSASSQPTMNNNASSAASDGTSDTYYNASSPSANKSRESDTLAPVVSNGETPESVMMETSTQTDEIAPKAAENEQESVISEGHEEAEVE